MEMCDASCTKTAITNAVSDRFHRERRGCVKIKDGCWKAYEYNHGVIHCIGCLHAHQYRYPCNIFDCICSGNGFLYPVEGNNEGRKAIHVFPHDTGSVRVDLKKPKQAKERTQKRFEKLMGIQQQHQQQDEEQEMKAFLIEVFLDDFEDLSYCMLEGNDMILSWKQQVLMREYFLHGNTSINNNENFWNINIS